MDFGGFFPGDFNIGRASSDHHHRLPDFGSGGFLETNPFLKNHQRCYSNSDKALDLCQKLSQMGISCDMSIWSRPDPVNLSGSNHNLTGASRIHNDSSVFQQNYSFHGVSSQGERRLRGFQDSFNHKGLEEMLALKNHRDLLLLDHINGPFKRISSPCLQNVSFGNDARVSQSLAAMEASRKLEAFYHSEDSLIGQGSFGNDAAFKGSRKLEAFYQKGQGIDEMMSNGLPLSLVSMVKIYGSVNIMAKDQIGCRVLQKLVDQGTILDAKVIFLEIIDYVTELSMDPFGNYLIQKLLDVCDDEHRTLIVSVLTSKPVELIRICLNTYGTRVVQKMIETVKTKQQIALVKSGLKPGFLTLVKDLNGNHVIQSCLEFLGPNDNKFVLEAATKYCAEIATHRHGCCVLQCCLSQSTGEQRERLVTEICRNSLHLSQDPFGNYVVQYLIEHKVSAVKLLIQFRLHYAELAIQKFSSHVVEKCLRQYPESRAEIVRELLSVPNFEHLLQDPYANYVIQTALSVTKGPVHARLVEKVNRFGKLQSSPYCKKIFSKASLKKRLY
ncbi:Pumilio-like protein 9 [Cardamine amara subsp. amara]|uniref:Pumilio-like protein 9 n=1 Tax=Cardamine amara subsp. amara TaxID=228776 RepID=A0ABD1ABE8_CARAN